MCTYKEKLGLVSELIALAKADNVVSPAEYGFLQSIAADLGIEEKRFLELFDQPVKKPSHGSQGQRIVQFHRLVLLMNVDQEQDQREVEKLYNLGLHMGVPPGAIQQVLAIMHQYPNKIVPPDVLISIFKAHNN
ncbi:TerB family tellurite resistance protein [Lentiprolixibacter aurantiacus]|uniref:TerB family tellurite resistance protein n=1 Tax=Lentiprolixibacter aurantiacus TaxID=2993939 RepID=A0AAE3SPP9_9FLAO|nr:TerB family tellurite resistance protein [Lentiprolixibacter aurantiacus]MCX2720481.1 TerB family tellurite resistance protein [Lentiprolixibacter aurantiacus]